MSRPEATAERVAKLAFQVDVLGEQCAVVFAGQEQGRPWTKMPTQQLNLGIPSPEAG